MKTLKLVDKFENLARGHFIGTWINDNLNTGGPGITRVVIRFEAEDISVHMWGKCFPQDCDWGEETATYSDADPNRLFVKWNQGFVERNQVLYYLNDGRLKVETHSHYIDDSGRSDRDDVEYFTKIEDSR